MENIIKWDYVPLLKPVKVTEQHWPKGAVPYLSILCITFNHVNFIREAIEGFLMQETTFPIEILIHDDASTDGTADIVRQYASTYPSLIKPIYQEENQFSRQVKVSLTYQLPRIQGQFVATCEGDDYWVDSRKLEIQVKLLSEYPEISTCFHPVFWQSGGKKDRFLTDYGAPSIKSQYDLTELFIHSNFIPTCSVVYRRDVDLDYPKWLWDCPIGDHPGNIIRISRAKKTVALMYPVPMGVYRRHAGGIHGGNTAVKNAQNLFLTYRMMQRDPVIGGMADLSKGAEIWRQRLVRQISDHAPIMDIHRLVSMAAEDEHRFRRLVEIMIALMRRALFPVRTFARFARRGMHRVRVILGRIAPLSVKRPVRIISVKFKERKIYWALSAVHLVNEHGAFSGISFSEKIIKDSRYRAIEFARLQRFDETTWLYRYKPRGWPNLYASTYATMLFGLTHVSDDLDPTDREGRAAFINQHQSPDGLYRDMILENDIAETEDWWGWRHLSAHVVTALSCLGARTKHPFHFLEPLYEVNACRNWITNLPWRDKPDFVSNTVMNYGVLLQYNRDFWGHEGAAQALNEIFAYLDSVQDPDSGLWGYEMNSGARGLSRGVQTAYHLWNLYFYDQRPVQYIERAIDHLLKTQNDLGGFGVPLNSSACEDIDSIDPLCRFSRLTDYRRDDIRQALHRALQWVAVNQIDDGGFVFRRFEPFEYGHPLMASGKDEANLFATWFRMLSIAYISETLYPEQTETLQWHWVRCPGYQFWHSSAPTFIR